MESPARRRVDGPRSSADAGLAEWTSRIKALQRDVDADEELEQRRLEEEIRASRLARSRRSGGSQFAGRVSLGNVDADEENGSSRADALRKLGGEATTRTSSNAATPSLSSSTNAKPEPVSLAAFIGGKATGPRLNKPAPQQDAHDPTQFQQRTRADIVAPHPVFGRGGIALVGLADKGKEVVESTKTPELNVSPSVKENVKPVAATTRTSPPTLATINTGANSNARGSATHARNWSRERTMSSPSPYTPIKAKTSPPPIISSGSPGLKGRMESLYAHANRSSERVAQPTLRGSKSSDKLAQKPVAPAKPEALRKSQATIVTTVETPPRPSAVPLSASTSTPPPRIQTPGSATFSKSTSTAPASVPSLARPIQLQQRPTSTGPQIPQSKVPAPAFLKPTQQKDLTPSLSRLQGRGFVQSVVKLSSEIEAATSKGSGSPERPSAASPSSKRSSVLERWNPPSPSPSPSVGSTSSAVSAPPLRKAKTIDFTGSKQTDTTSSPDLVRPNPQPKPASLSASSAKSTPVKAKSAPVPAPGDVLPFGSSNTLISYIKPTKTGDAPQTDGPGAANRRSKTPSRHADERDSDELGVRPRSRSSNRSRASSPAKSAHAAATTTTTKSDLASSVPSSGRPLSHPTKDRAKLRRKGPGTQVTSKTEEQQEHESPTDDFTNHSSPGEADSGQVSASALEITPPATHQETSSPWTAEDMPARTSPASTPARGNNIRHLQDTWSNQGPIGVKPLRKPPLAMPSPTRSSFGPQVATKPIKQALPGLASTISEAREVHPPSSPLTPPLSINTRQERGKSPTSPTKQGRIPSTGSRPTVMDVAQAFNANANSSTSSAAPAVPSSPCSLVAGRPNDEKERERDPAGRNGAENERTITPALIKAERRRSVAEKYANFTLPALPEEKTPVSTPAGTLKGPMISPVPPGGKPEEEKNSINIETKARAEEPPRPKKPEFARGPTKIHVDVTDESLPAIDVARTWDVNPSRFNVDLDVHTVSVEVLSISGGSGTEIMKESDIGYVFYASEVLVVIHRAKSRSSGLVMTKVWAWIGRKAEVDESEERKMRELAKRYGTNLIKCNQFAEPRELVHVLGGTLVTREGTRALWSPENTTMHVVRSVAGVIHIDEVELHGKNLCSGFSYCISLLDTLWVWYGCGSVPAERSAILQYAENLRTADGKKNVVEVEEGQEDETFWMFLGEDGYARADYWKWRKCEKSSDPRFWTVDCANKESEVKELETFPLPAEMSDKILVIHLVYEIFTLIGTAARGRRRDIKFALTLAQELSSYTARSKPFRPPVHVLIFPSHIPLDLQSAIRGLDADAIHGSGEVPDHMHLLTINDAWNQLQRKEWNQAELADGNMMPLGLAPQ